MSGIQAKYPASSVGQWITYWDHQVGFAAPSEIKPLQSLLLSVLMIHEVPMVYTVFSFPRN